jgi:hypothetical protein
MRFARLKVKHHVERMRLRSLRSDPETGPVFAPMRRPAPGRVRRGLAVSDDGDCLMVAVLAAVLTLAVEAARAQAMVEGARSAM